MKKKILAIALCGIMALSMTACGAKKQEAAGPTEETQKAVEAVAEAEKAVDKAVEKETEKAVKEVADAMTVTKGVLTMGTNAQFPPYEYYDGDRIIGIDAEIASLIAAELGLELEIVDMDFSSIITSVQTGKIDIGMAGMTVTPERLENVYFSESYAKGVQVIIVPEGSAAIKSVDDLDGKLIGVQEGTTGHIYCAEDYGEENLVAYNNGATAVQALLQGKVDCVVIDQQPAKAFVEANKGLTILDTEYVTEEYAIAVSQDNEVLLTAVDAALAKLTKDGSVQKILDKYIKAE